MRPLASRLFGLLAATIVGLSAPSLGVLHGVAHAQAAEVLADAAYSHHADAHLDAPVADALTTAPTLHEHDAPDGHDHPTVAIGASGRPDAPIALVAERSLSIIAPTVQRSVVKVSREVATFHADGRAVRPSQPRAPPLG